MRKQIFGRRFKRDKNERKALFNGLISAMIINGSIKTTEQKAKSIKGDIEKLVTKAKKEENVARNLLQSHLKKREIDKMVTQIAPSFKNRNGGYTRIIKTGNRFNDNASMVILQWVEREEVVIAPKTARKKIKKTTKVLMKTTKKTVSKAATKTVRKEKLSSRKATKGK